MDDKVLNRVKRRAQKLQEWRGGSVLLQPPRAQVYQAGDHFDYNYDWQQASRSANRLTTTLVYLKAKFTGGGTKIPRSHSDKWCDVVDCDDDIEGTMFKADPGSAIY